MAVPKIELETGADRILVRVSGSWVFETVEEIERLLDRLPDPEGRAVVFRCADVERIDLTGAWMLYSAARELEKTGSATTFEGFRDAHLKFLTSVVDAPVLEPEPAGQKTNPLRSGLESIGRTVTGFLGELGEMLMMTVDGIRRPSSLAFRELVGQLMDTGIRAVPIIVLMSVLIGVVLGYQASAQLGRLGASAFTIDLVAISILREMGVLLTAIMVAGRSGSAFAASLGSMKLNEETDAMQVMGLSVNGTLVLPRILSLVIAVPILTIISDIAGLAGAWLVGIVLLDISTIEFIGRVEQAVSLNTLMVGLSKAPVFGLLVGAVGTLRGLQVRASAEELGQLTTRAVVEAIFLVVGADAVFSIIYTELGI